MKKLHPKVVNRISVAGLVLAMVCEVAAFFVPPTVPVLVPVGAVLAVGALIFQSLFFVCPFCGKKLGRSDGTVCPHCGREL